MRIHDISTLIHPDMIVYKNKEDKKPIITVVSDYNRGTSYESRALLDMHVGTHMDAPLHMIEGGDSIDINVLLIAKFLIYLMLKRKLR